MSRMWRNRLNLTNEIRRFLAPVSNADCFARYAAIRSCIGIHTRIREMSKLKDAANDLNKVKSLLRGGFFRKATTKIDERDEDGKTSFVYFFDGGVIRLFVSPRID